MPDTALPKASVAKSNGKADHTSYRLEQRQILAALRAFRKGDFSVRLPLDFVGVDAEIAETFNDVVEFNNHMTKEFERLSAVVGKEGKIGHRAKLAGATGGWEKCIDSINTLVGDMLQPTTEVARVIGAVAKGDLGQSMLLEIEGRPLRGEFLRIGKVVNTMVAQLGSFASEVTRVAREVGTEGKLGGQAKVEGVAGTWKDLTDNVNAMAANLTGQVRNIAEVTTAIATGNLSKKITVDVKGEILELKNTINTLVDQLNSFASEVTRVAREVGTEGKLGGQAKVEGVAGTWKDLTDNVNAMAANLTGQVRNIAEVTTAIATGNLSKKITVDVKGEILELKNTINTLVDQLNSFASEVTRVAREVGTEGKLGGQAKVEGVAGTWKDLTDNVNMMAANLTGQVRGIAEVVTAVAQGDLKRKLTVDAKGEIAALADTINGMIETLAIFADQVTNVAREVGIEGKLGGQAKVPGAAGLWRDLTDNVNQLAANLTTQVRAIAEVATAVTKGDLTRSIAVEASGEVAALKDNINEMIRNLKETTLKNTEQDWLKTNLAKFTRMLQGERDLVTVSNLILSELAPLVGAQHGVFYITNTDPEDEEDKGTFLDMVASYAFKERKNLSSRYRLREGLIGQCAFEKESIMLTHVPSDYIQINSGLGEAPPLSIIVLPVLFEGECKAVIELASFSRFSETHRSFLDQLMESIGIVLNTIAANMRTEGLLKQSQLLTTELQSQQEELKKTNDRLEMQANSLRQSEEMLKAQQEELRRTNEELEEKASLLSQEKKQVEEKNREVEIAKAALEEKAEQLALTSKYKSEFLANMSHELRTPLNSLLILSKLLADNPQGNLNPKQTEFARTINSAGSDLLALINDILDLSKIESGTVTIEIDDVEFGHVSEHMERTFRQVAQDRKLGFKVEVDRHLPNVMRTDGKRLQQVINNLLANAFKFTETGEVRLQVEAVTGGWSSSHPVLNSAKQVVAFSVIDTGIGVPEDKQKIIFEAFQQADGTTSRKYGGTGLGLSISREIAQRLGGEIRIESQPGKGSTFTLYLPLNYEPAAQAAAKVQHASPSAPTVSASALPMPREPISSELADDRDRIGGEDPVLLIVEDDPEGAALMMAVAREQGFKALVSLMGTATVGLAKRYRPKAITIDLDLSDIEGWSLFDELKHDPETRHIPLHLFGADAKARRGLEMGAVGYTAKPLGKEAMSEAAARLKAFSEREGRRLLLVDADNEQRAKQAELLATPTVEVVQANSAKDALKALALENFDCMVLSLGLPRGSAYQVLERLATLEAPPPVVAYSNRDIGEAEESKLKSYADSFTVKQALSSEEILDLSCLYLHQDIAALGEERRQLLIRRQQRDPQLDGRSVLIIDDDIRNIFTLTSVLEQHGINVVFAENGRDGIQKLRDTKSVDVALVDVMMPEMDGYEVMREIRRDPAWGKLPVVAVTAKAMQGDRKKCIEAGASDYLAKPVDVSQLLATLRAWVVQ